MTPIQRSDGVPPSGGGGVDADPDPDGVALAAATATGVFLGPRFAGTAAWIAAACCLAVACLTLGGASRLRDEGTGGAVVGVLVLGALLASGAAAASVRATAVRGGILVGRAGQPARVEVAATVAEEPRRTRYGGFWVVLTVTRVELAGRTFRTRERAGIVLYPDRLPAQQFEGQPGAGRPPDADRSAEPGPSEDRLAVGTGCGVRASVAAAR